jgi:hypothetical protein
MKVWVKTAGAVKSEPINHRPWQELVDDFDGTLEFAAAQETEEAIVDLWLEDPRSFMDGDVDPVEQRSAARLVKTGGNGWQRPDVAMSRTASARFDQEFADAKAHADSVLKKLGNAARG